MTNNIPTPDETPTAVALPAGPDKTPPPVVGPIVALLQSRKFIVTLLALAGAFVLVGAHRLPWEEAVAFAKWVLGFWLVAHATEEGLDNFRRPG
jgi:hypothetical protein